jgi:uncharacterized protein (DUF305 family)
MNKLTLSIVLTALLGGGALAAECPAPTHDGMAMASPMEPAPLDDAHAMLMSGMDAMNSSMMAGAAAADIDVAFVCSMIPHHQGAIDMAKAVLANGDDVWVRELAQKIIDAQTAEIAAMREWLKKQP